MAGATGTTPDALALYRRLQEEPYGFGFYAVLRRLECLHSEQPRIGRSTRPSQDPVRLAQTPSLAFAPASLSAFELGSGAAPRLEVLFLGLLGPNGPLPLHLTEYARDRLRNYDDPTFARFLDVFHHRMLSLFYRAWARVRPAVSFDRPAEDRFGEYVASLCGLGMHTLRNRDPMPDLAKLHFAGLLGCHTRHAEGLEGILRTLLGLRVRIQELVGGWLLLPESGRCRLGETPVTGTLGATATIGERVYDCQHRFRIVLGPLSLAEYRSLLPGNERLRLVLAVVRNYVGLELAWDLNPVLRKEEVPALALGQGARLGWTTWLKVRDFEHDAADLRLDVEAYAG